MPDLIDYQIQLMDFVERAVCEHDVTINGEPIDPADVADPEMFLPVLVGYSQVYLSIIGHDLSWIGINLADDKEALLKQKVEFSGLPETGSFYPAMSLVLESIRVADQMTPEEGVIELNNLDELENFIICAVRPLSLGRGYKALSKGFFFKKIAL